MDAKSWKVEGGFCFFAGRRLLRSLGAIALIAALFDNSIQRAGFGITCLIAAHFLRPEKSVGDHSVNTPPQKPDAAPAVDRN